MWSHYAEEHRGVVFKLRCIDEIDNTLLAARKVSYTDSFIAFPSAEHYAKHLTDERPIDLVPLCWNIAFTKHIDCAYEREWRVHIALLREPPGDGYATYPENARIFEGHLPRLSDGTGGCTDDLQACQTAPARHESIQSRQESDGICAVI